MNKKILSLMLVGAALVSFLPKTALAEKAQVGVVIKDKVYIRTEASVNSPDLGILEMGEKVYVEGSSGDWTQISFGSISGYIRSDLLDRSGEGAVQQEQAAQPVKDTSTALRFGDSGERVSALQTALKEKGYFFSSVTGSFGSVTKAAVEDFQKQNGLEVDGVAGTITLTALYEGKLPEKSGSSKTPSAGEVVMADWFTVVDAAFPRGATATVTDVDTGLSFRVKRQGGYNHADIEPLTAEDTAKCKKAYGGVWSWDRRAVILTLDDGRRFAASINGMPHGADTVPYNDMNGQICIHFLNSRTHCSDKVCPLHQAMVKKAYEAYHN